MLTAKQRLGANIARIRKMRGLSQAKFGEAVNKGQTTISSWETGRTEPSSDELVQVALALNVEVQALRGDAQPGGGEDLVQIIGTVGADPSGAVIRNTGQQSYDRIPGLGGGRLRESALEVRGHSMRGFVDDGGIIYFAEQHPSPTPMMLGQVVVAELENGEIVVKRLLKGSQPGLYDLESINGPTIEDAPIKWVALVTGTRTPLAARQLIVRAGDDQAA
jgi:transcriptional regulator with XRE-family HTH domain